MIKSNNESAATQHNKYATAKMGMWIFLFTELLFFGGMFLLYSVFRSKYAADFHTSASELNIFFGTANTAILLTSSATMALSIGLLRNGKKGLSILCQFITIAMGLVFLVNKYIEWGAHINAGIYPHSPGLEHMGRGKVIFFSLYYVMTGIHGIHVLVGICVILGILVFTAKDIVHQGDFVKLENTGLYWHFVDIIWIYLFPLFYLIT
jgi:cytochrome c oxidase subunit 3